MILIELYELHYHLGSVSFFFKETDTFIQQGQIKCIKSYNIDIYNVIKGLQVI